MPVFLRPKTAVAQGMLSTLHATGGASAPQHAQAVRAVQLPDGSTEMAYEFDIALQVIALRGSIPADVNLEFRKALSKYGQFRLSQRSQLKDIFEELSNARQALQMKYYMINMSTTFQC